VIGANMRVSKAFDLPNKSAKKDSNPRQLILALNGRNFLNHPNLAAPDDFGILIWSSSAVCFGPPN